MMLFFRVPTDQTSVAPAVSAPVLFLVIAAVGRRASGAGTAVWTSFGGRPASAPVRARGQPRKDEAPSAFSAGWRRRDAGRSRRLGPLGWQDAPSSSKKPCVTAQLLKGRNRVLRCGDRGILRFDPYCDGYASGTDEEKASGPMHEDQAEGMNGGHYSSLHILAVTGVTELPIMQCIQWISST